MAEKKEKKTASQKLNSFLDKNRKGLLGFFAIVIVALIGYVVFVSVNSNVTKKNISQIEAISYELTNKSSTLEEAELNKRIETAKEQLAAFANKSGIAGVRANMLLAEIAYSQKDYEKAIDAWTNVVSKGKKSYTAPIAKYQLGVCYEQTKDFAKAAECYKDASEAKDFPLASHALFSYARVLETQSNFTQAIEAYSKVVQDYASDEWANLSKTRLLDLEIQGKK